MNSRLLSPVLHKVNNCQTDDNIQNVRTSSKYHRAEGSKPKVLGCFGFGYLVWTLSSPVFQLYPKITPNSKLPINHPLFRTTHKSPFIPNTYTHTHTQSYSTLPLNHPLFDSRSANNELFNTTHPSSITKLFTNRKLFNTNRYSTLHTFCITCYSNTPYLLHNPLLNTTHILFHELFNISITVLFTRISMGTQLHKHTQKGLACNTLLILMSLCATGVVSHHMRHGTVPLHLKPQTFQNGPTVSRCASYLIASHISVPFTCTISYRHFKTGLQLVDVQATLSLHIYPYRLHVQ